MRITRRTILKLSAYSLATLPLSSAFSQAYPSRFVRMVVPFPPGSITDIVTRLISNELQQSLGQAFVVENKPGAQTTIGATFVARSPPDGYTLLVSAISFVGAVSEIKNLPYSPNDDFTPLALLGTFPLVLMVKPDFPAHTPAEFLSRLKTNEKKWNGGYGSSSTRLAIAQLQNIEGISIQAIPYKGIPLAMVDLIGGTIDFTFVDIGNALTYAKAGKLKAIGVTSAMPSPHAPDWPSLVNLVSGLDMSAWLAVIGPKGMPTDISTKLHNDIMRVVALPSIRRSLDKLAMTPPQLTLAQMKPFIASEVEKWSRLYKAAGIEPQ